MSDPAEMGAPPRTLVALLDGGRSAIDRAATDRCLAALWSRLNWRARVYLVELPGTGVRDRIGEVIADLAETLHDAELCSVVVHPFVALDSAGQIRCEQYLELARPLSFQSYQRQSEPRLAIFPVLEPLSGSAVTALIEVAEKLHRVSAKPSAYLRGADALEVAAAAAAAELRFYVEAEDGENPATAGADPRLGQLLHSHVFEDLLDRVDHGGELLARCSPHVVVIEGGTWFGCFDEARRGRALATGGADVDAAWTGFAPPAELCRGCIHRSALAMADNLVANARRDEGRRVHLELARVLAGRDDGSGASAHAAAAAALAEAPADRAAAQIVEGLCHLGAGDLAAAEAALAKAAGSALDPGLVAYHRGRVQLSWRDPIEALDHFEVAMRSPSVEVPRAELYFHMTVCHVELEEYDQAEGYLGRWQEAGGDPATVEFYRGLCRLGSGDAEDALAGFRRALAEGPRAADLGRVHFYLGHTLKELGRFSEAVPALEQAVAADPDELAGHNLLGFCYYKTARHEAAVACFRRAIALEPGSAIDHANLGSNLRDLGRVDEAVAMYRRALELDPRLDFARDNLARLTSADPDQDRG